MESFGYGELVTALNLPLSIFNRFMNCIFKAESFTLFMLIDNEFTTIHKKHRNHARIVAFSAGLK